MHRDPIKLVVLIIRIVRHYCWSIDGLDDVDVKDTMGMKNLVL